MIHRWSHHRLSGHQLHHGNTRRRFSKAILVGKRCHWFTVVVITRKRSWPAVSLKCEKRTIVAILDGIVSLLRQMVFEKIESPTFARTTSVRKKALLPMKLFDSFNRRIRQAIESRTTTGTDPVCDTSSMNHLDDQVSIVHCLLISILVSQHSTEADVRAFNQTIGSSLTNGFTEISFVLN